MPYEACTVVNDIVRGRTEFENALLDDLVIARADGTPVYHLAVVVDDMDEGITHVVRGADHYSNTPKHVRIYEALGADVPVYAHLPLLHGPDGKKLSKRHGAAFRARFARFWVFEGGRRQLPGAAGLGVRRIDHLLQHPGVAEALQPRARIQGPAVFDEQKLRWVNGRTCASSRSTT